MKQYDAFIGEIIEIKMTAFDVCDMLVKSPKAAKLAKPGQFAQIFVPGKTLRRPISFCDIDRTNGTLRFVFQIRGEGTKYLAGMKRGEALDMLAPLGNGFETSAASRRALFVGGGIGVPPLLAASKQFGPNAVLAAGFKSKENIILKEEFEKNGCKVLIATDDGSYGHHGLVTDIIKDLEFDVIYACGPRPMLMAVSRIAEEKNILCYVSMEERMACGIGACLGCAVKLCGGNGEYYGHVCKDGPVFDSRNIIWR